MERKSTEASRKLSECEQVRFDWEAVQGTADFQKRFSVVSALARMKKNTEARTECLCMVPPLVYFFFVLK